MLGLDGQGPTPQTPEILNSLIAMTNPFDAISSMNADDTRSSAASPPGKTLF